MRYQLRPFFVEAFQWYPGVTHPRIYASVMPVYMASPTERINPVGAIPYAGGEQAWVLETLAGNTRQLEPGDWVVISEDTQMLCVIDDDAAMAQHYIPALPIPEHVRSRAVEI